MSKFTSCGSASLTFFVCGVAFTVPACVTPGTSAIGHRYRFGDLNSDTTRIPWITVVGVVADMRHWINNTGQYTPLGSAALTHGAHHVVLEYEGPDLHPGSGGAQFGFGPLVLSRDDDDAPVATVGSADASTLCQLH